MFMFVYVTNGFFLREIQSSKKWTRNLSCLNFDVFMVSLYTIWGCNGPVFSQTLRYIRNYIHGRMDERADGQTEGGADQPTDGRTDSAEFIGPRWRCRGGGGGGGEGTIIEAL